jgi:hypothetical protein
MDTSDKLTGIYIIEIRSKSGETHKERIVKY